MNDIVVPLVEKQTKRHQTSLPCLSVSLSLSPFSSSTAPSRRRSQTPNWSAACRRCWTRRCWPPTPTCRGACLSATRPSTASCYAWRSCGSAARCPKPSGSTSCAGRRPWTRWGGADTLFVVHFAVESSLFFFVSLCPLYCVLVVFSQCFAFWLFFSILYIVAVLAVSLPFGCFRSLFYFLVVFFQVIFKG